MAEIIGTVLIVLLCLGGLVALLQSFCEWLMSPGREDTMVLLIPLRGHREDAELVLRSAVQRVRRMGGKDQKTLLCVDCGMDAETRDICERFCADFACMEITTPEELPETFRCKTVQKDV